jgi:cell division protein DivIC
MKRKKFSRTSKRRLAFFGTLSLIVIGYAVFSFVYYSVNLLKAKNENINLENKLKSLQNDEENLKIEIQKLKDPEYIARYARENYSYSKDGEYIIKLDSSNKNEKQEKKQNNNYIYYVVIGCCFIIIVTVLLNKKKKPVK